MDLHNIVIAVTEAVQNSAEVLNAAAPEVAEHAAEENVIGTLGLNWKLFLAQLVNFGIVLFIFWKWIVKPLGKTLSDRQEKIEGGLKNAEAIEKERREFDVWKSNEMKNTRVEAEKILKMATDTAGKMKQDIVVDAHNQSEKILEQAKAHIESEKVQMLKEVRQEVATLVVTASEKILREKLDHKKDQEIINESLKNLR